jgi:hypothetical protein
MLNGRSRAAVIAGILIVVPSLFARAIGASDIPSDLHAAIQQRETEAAGFTVFDRQRTQSIQFPGHSETKILEISKARHGTEVFDVVVRKMTKNGEAVSADELASFQAVLNKSPILETAYELPIGQDREADFTYTGPQHCADCEEAVVQFDFRAKERGENNADGSIFVDTKTHHIVRITYAPVILPKPASQSTCTMQFGAVLPGLWDIVRDEQHFSGRQFFMLGRVDFVSHFEHYRRVKSEAGAREALTHASN